MDETARAQQDRAYREAAAAHGAALARLAAAYADDRETRQDLQQDIHFALWRSFAGYAGQCSVRTWVFRVAHNVCVAKRVRRRRAHFVDLDTWLAQEPLTNRATSKVDDALTLDRLRAVIRRLKPPDDQLMVLYLEGLDAMAIGEVTGLSSRAVAMRVHRVKALLRREFGVTASE